MDLTNRLRRSKEYNKEITTFNCKAKLIGAPGRAELHFSYDANNDIIVDEVELKGYGQVMELYIPSFVKYFETSSVHKSDLVHRITKLKVSGGSGLRHLVWLIGSFVYMSELDISELDTSSMTSMSGMFQGCGLLKSLDVSKLNTSKVEDMDFMFSSCDSLQTLDCSNFDTSNVKTMQSMFSHCCNLKTLNVQGFNTDKVDRLNYMFCRCESLENIDISSFSFKSVSECSEMFSGCKSIKSIKSPISCETPELKYCYMMFNGCRDLEELDTRFLAIHGSAYMQRMFDGCSKLRSIDLSNVRISSLSTISGVFNECKSLEYLDIRNFGDVYFADSMIYTCKALKTVVIPRECFGIKKELDSLGIKTKTS